MEKSMSNSSGRRLALSAVLVLAIGASAAQAQFITDVNSVIVNEYHFFCCNSELTTTNNYPTSVVFDDQYSSTTGGIHFAQRHDLIFSSDGGSTPRLFNTTDSYDISFDIKLEAGVNAPRKEAGLILEQSIGTSHFIVNTDAHEIVVFGGFQPFYSFNTSNGLTYNSGDTIRMRQIYTGKTETTPGTFQYLVTKDSVTYSSPLMPSGRGRNGYREQHQYPAVRSGQGSKRRMISNG